MFINLHSCDDGIVSAWRNAHSTDGVVVVYSTPTFLG
jgi:hypothetical protein